MSASITVAMLFGGQSAEHEVSVNSARNVHAALVEAGYRVVPIGIDEQGVWHLAPEVRLPDPAWPEVAILPGSGGEVRVLGPQGRRIPVDVVFPVLHGPNGEDGSVQGLLQLANVPFVGCGLFASALSMDKVYAKQHLAAAGLPVVEGLWFEREGAPGYEEVAGKLGPVLFVKPANMGSSVGVSKVKDAAGYEAALARAFRHDSKVLVERFAKGREIECAVLSRKGLEASEAGEIVPVGRHGFYSYEAKYLDAEGARLMAPAQLPPDVRARAQALSIEAARALACEGMVRVDFFLLEDGRLLINELNTIPGFTQISMYPKLWEISGVPPAALVRHLIDHALVRFRREAALAQVPESGPAAEVR